MNWTECFSHSNKLTPEHSILMNNKIILWMIWKKRSIVSGSVWVVQIYSKNINVFSIWLSHSIPSSLLCHKTMPSTVLRYEMWCLLFVYYTTYRKTGTHLSTFSFTYTLSHTLTQRPNPSKIYPHKVLLRIRPSSNRRSINSCRIIYLSNRIVWNYFIFAFVRFHSRIHKAQFPTCANILIHIDINGRNGEKQYIILVN